MVYLRHFQADAYEHVALAGAVIEKLVGVVDADRPDSDLAPVLLYLQLHGHVLQRCFVEPWMGVWEEVDSIEEGDDAYRLVDYTLRFALQGRCIKSVVCCNSRIRILLKPVGLLELSPQEGGASLLSFEERSFSS